MDNSAELTRYTIWALVVLAGIPLAIVDWQMIKRPIFGVLLILGISAGATVTFFSPFNFADGGYYMEGIIVSAGSALVFLGYVPALLAIFLWRRLAKKPPN